MPKKILFICYGNVARSQMAEAYYNVYSKSDDAASAGVSMDSADRYKHPVDDVVKIMREDGIDISKNVVKKLTPQLVDEYEKIVVLCDLSDCPKYLTDSRKIIHWPIADPYNLGMNFSRSVREDIKLMVLELLGQ